MVRSIRFTILGESANKSNQRQLTVISGSPRIIKSKKALSYSKSFREQLPEVEELLEGPIAAHITIFNASRRPDLDAELLYDLMQFSSINDKRGFRDGKGLFLNDRQVRRKYVDWALDKENPRAEIFLIECPELDPF